MDLEIGSTSKEMNMSFSLHSYSKSGFLASFFLWHSRICLISLYSDCFSRSTQNPSSHSFWQLPHSSIATTSTEFSLKQTPLLFLPLMTTPPFWKDCPDLEHFLSWFSSSSGVSFSVPFAWSFSSGSTPVFSKMEASRHVWLLPTWNLTWDVLYVWNAHRVS